jgi:hypothetical protein
VYAPDLQYPSGELQAGKYILSLQVWKFSQYIFDRVTTGEIFEDEFHWVPQATKARLAVRNLRID